MQRNGKPLDSKGKSDQVAQEGACGQSRKAVAESKKKQCRPYGKSEIIVASAHAFPVKRILVEMDLLVGFQIGELGVATGFRRCRLDDFLFFCGRSGSLGFRVAFFHL